MQFSSDDITFRMAQLRDCKIYFDWANDPVVRKNAHNPAPIGWDDHVKWFNNKLESETLMLIFFDGKVPVGQLRVDSVGKSGLIDFSVDEEYRGRNIGRSMLTSLIKLAKVGRLFNSLNAQVKSDNISSIKSFTTADFTVISNKIVNAVDCKVFEYVLK
ncbi:GNAT family N-acetyltransferase [Chryseolinea sp. H1M3-3]|uniref:GNAT family N-acetyltransferase n=1 Tax=Chryseolinea sp. H1M3-3 TaxID=3034144 RepID=UPI0023ECDF46|nr:GNAT family N-acetyltransferase [Chryseolinea sp. H1M3-3]